MAGCVQTGLAAAPAQVCNVREVGGGDPGNSNAVESEAKKGRCQHWCPGLNSVTPMLMSTQNLRMCRYLEIRSLQR